MAANAHSDPLAPAYILRAHAAPVACLCFSQNGRYLFSGDTDGYVAVWRLRTFRPRYMWKAHGGGILGIAQVGTGLLTQGRDNFVHLFHFAEGERADARVGPTIDVGAATAVPSASHPSPGFDTPAWTLDVNAMNFCRMSVLTLAPESDHGSSIAAPEQKGKSCAGEADPHGALIAVPSLTKDDFVDVFHYPSKARIHRSVGKDAFIGYKTGSVMAVHLFYPSPAAPVSASPTNNTTSGGSGTPDNPELHLLIGYESGHLALFRFEPGPSFEAVPIPKAASFHRPQPGKMVEENEGWELVWVEKGHRDAVMSLAVDTKARFAYTVAADHFVCKYRIVEWSAEEAALPRMHVEPTPSPGKSGVAIRDDGKLLATAGWDGELRLYSAKTLAPLAVLSLHRLSLQAVAFAPIPRTATDRDSIEGTESDDDEQEEGSAAARRRLWLATGGQEFKISLWEPYPPRPR
ncbi:hypothetical protein JCM3774_002499 [Rhodotorula dairenensis]